MGLVPHQAAVPSATSESVKTGPPRFLESPSHTSAPLLDPGRSSQPRHDGRLGVVPRSRKGRTPALR